MQRAKKLTSHADSPSSRAGLGGKVAHYRSKEKIYSQGTPAYTLFYIQAGGGRPRRNQSISRQRSPRSWEWAIFLASFVWWTFLFGCPQPLR
jgi:hypothetical protein